MAMWLLKSLVVYYSRRLLKSVILITQEAKYFQLWQNI